MLICVKIITYDIIELKYDINRIYKSDLKRGRRCQKQIKLEH